MKACLLLVGSLVLWCVPLAQAQTQSTPSTEWTVTERGPHHAVHERDEVVDLGNGRVERIPHRFVELATGLNVWDEGRWKESKAEFTVLPDGYALAAEGQHRLLVSPALNDPAGVVDMETPDGKRMRSTLRGLQLFNHASGQSMLIAEVNPDAVGYLVGPDEVLFTNAFTGFGGWVRYLNEKGGYHQDVILTERLNLLELEAAGFLPEHSSIEIWTEFIEFPAVRVTTRTIRSETDPQVRALLAEPDRFSDDLDFGVMKMPDGRAYLANQMTDQQDEVRVSKWWTEIEGKRFLIESIPLDQASTLLAQLPAGNSTEELLKGKPLYAGRRAPPASETHRDGRSIQTAGLDLREHLKEAPQFTWDYELNSSQTNFTFQSDTTYYVSSSVNLYDTTTIEGGVVIKYKQGVNAQLQIYGSLDCQTGPYRPAILTAKDDDSVGETISGSSGSPSGTYAYAGLRFGSPAAALELHDLQVSYANYGILIFPGGAHTHVVENSRFSHNSTAVYADYTTLLTRNLLIHKSSTRAIYGFGSTVGAENLTIHEANKPFDGGTVGATNCLFVSITNWPTAFISVNNATNSSSAFQAVGAGAHYLAEGSTNRNAGTTNINADLLADLKRKTTYPPIEITNNIVVDTVLSPQAQRDTDLPDLGYHYDPLDYVVSGRTVAANLTLTDGVAVGTYGGSSTYGLGLNSGNFVSEGKADRLNWIVRYNTVQEQTDSSWSTDSAGMGIQRLDSAASVNARFTGWSLLGAEGSHYRDFLGSPASFTKFFDCQLSGGAFTGTGSMELKNNLWNRVRSFLETGEETMGAEWAIRYNLYYGGLVYVWVYEDAGPVSAVDNLFDHTTIQVYEGEFSSVKNAYVTGEDRLYPLGAGDVILTNGPVYATGPLGDFYLASSSPTLVDAGSSYSYGVGLYHFTTQADQTKETDSIVDIGFHYVAVDGEGVPLDEDSDGVPDYLEDANGNGDVDSGETDWESATDLGLRVLITRPKDNYIIP